MASVVVCGGAVVGLATGLLLARAGHRVVVLERDAEPPPEPGRAWEWQRKGVSQFQQPHNLLPRFRRLLDAELPDLTAALLEAGCRSGSSLAALPAGVADRSARPGDERFLTINGRRPVVEAVLARVAAAEPGLEVRRGVRVTGLLAPTGVQTDAGPVRADLVVDALGRTSPVSSWLATPPLIRSQDRGFVYYTRYFRGAELPAEVAPALAALECFSVMTLPGDGDTWGVTLSGSSADRELRELRRPEVFDRLVGALPGYAHWIEGEPLSAVLPMAGIVDTYRRFVVDGVPVAERVVSIGDAWACTNPSAGRGLSLGVLQAVLLRDCLGEGLADLSLRLDDATERELTPYFVAQEAADRDRLAELDACREGRPVPPGDPQLARLWSSAGKDPDAFRGLMDDVGCLAHRDDVLARPTVAAAMLAVGSSRRRPYPGPSRPELVELLTLTL
jgi:2-polyprenyl-6-methoxyphenol hydroxylase-like FAD-dependent oxidoreductase